MRNHGNEADTDVDLQYADTEICYNWLHVPVHKFYVPLKFRY